MKSIDVVINGIFENSTVYLNLNDPHIPQKSDFFFAFQGNNFLTQV